MDTGIVFMYPRNGQVAETRSCLVAPVASDASRHHSMMAIMDRLVMSEASNGCKRLVLLSLTHKLFHCVNFWN